MVGPTVTVFTTNHCPSCQSLKDWLTKNEIDFTVVNLEENPARQAEVFQKSGRYEVPVTIIAYSSGEERVINGPRYGEIKQALNIEK